MKQQRHKHKESFSILLISHTGRESRQFHISLFSFRLFLLFLLLLCVLIGYAVYCFLQSDSGREDLLMQIASRDQTIAEMEK